MWEPKSLSLEEIGACGLVHANSKRSHLKRSNSFRGMVLVMPIRGLQIDVEQLEIKATT